MNQTKWPAATRENPCPKCGKVNRCRITPDGQAGICWRSGSSEIWRDTRAGANGNGRRLRADPPRTRPRPTYTSADAAIDAAGKSIRGGTLVVVWKYPGDVARVARFNLKDGSKEFRPVYRLDNGAWAIGDPPGLWPLYRVDELPTAGPVYVCEGEKATDCAWSIGLPAVTSAHGSNAADKSDWNLLAGRDVVILPDNDSAGERYSRDVTAILLRLNPPARVKVVRLPDLPPGGDIVEFDADIGGEAGATKAAVEELVAKTPFVDATSILGGPVLTRLADVEPQAVQWLWPDRIAIGKLNLIFGDPGKGKSFITLDMAARISTGNDWPDGCGCAPKGNVILINCEDDLADTIRPRLDKAGADVRKIIALEAIKRPIEGGKMVDRSFTLADMPALAQAVERTPDVRLVVIDPVSAYIANSDSHNNAEIRGLLAPLAMLATKHRVAVVMVTHMSKSGGSRAMYRAMGSLAFIAAARSAWVVVPDKDDPKRRLFLPAKNNIGNDETGLAFGIIDGAVAWENDPVTMRADEALALELEADSNDRKPGPEPKARNAAADWLRELLVSGPIRVGSTKKPEPRTIAQAVKDAGLSWGTIRRAREALGIKPYKGQFNDGWYWKLPPAEAAQGAGEPIQAQTSCASSAQPAHLGSFDCEKAASILPVERNFADGAHLQVGSNAGNGLQNGDDEGAQDKSFSRSQ